MRLARTPIALERQQKIVRDRVALEHGRLLELATDAEFGDLGLVEAGEVVHAVEIDLALVRARLTGDDVHHGGLAGAVRPDHRAHLARLDRQREVVECAEAVERDGHSVEIEQRRCGAGRHDTHSAG
jgi:hypothetical protein